MRYQVGGSLHSDDPSYVVRQADEQLYTSLKGGDFCYVFNSRQMGKSSLLQRISRRLKSEGYKCIYLDVTQLGSEDTTSAQWYKGIIVSMFYALNLAEHVNFKQWWDMQTGLSPIQKLHHFVEEVLLPNVKSDCETEGTKGIFIFIDEIDSLLSLNFPVNDFFAWIRHCYNQQAHDPNFQRLGFALFGVASPSDLIADKRRTPFNIGTAIELYGFRLDEASPLLDGLKEAISQPEIVLQEVIYWTGGQPFLTQKLCQLVLQAALKTSERKIILSPKSVAYWVGKLVRSQVIQHWESLDEPEHFRTIRDRLLFNQQQAGRLLSLYQQVLQAEEVGEWKDANREDTSNSWHSLPQISPVLTDDSREQTELLLSGLVEKYNGYLRIKNPIYRSIFNSEWVLRQLDNLRPYSQPFNAWVASDFQDESRLLRGNALQEVLDWTQRKSLSDLDYRFLAASQELERREAEQKLEVERLKETEARLASEQKSARRQQRLLLGVSLALLAAIVLGITTVYADRQAQMSEVRAIASASNGSFNSNQRLDALVQAIRARRKFQRLDLQNLTDANALDFQTRKVLEQAVYGADEFNHLSGHQGIVLGVDFSPDGQWIVSSSIDRTVKLWRRDGTLVRTIPHTATINSVRFSPDSRLIVAGGIDGAIRLWTLDGKLLTIFKGHKSAVWRVAFSPDGQTIASASGDFTVKLWQLDGTLIRTLKHERSIWAIAFSPDGQTLASCMVGGTNQLWRLDGTLIKRFTAGNATIWSVAFSPDGQTLVSGGADKMVRLWNREGTLLRTLKGHTSEVFGVAFSPDGQTIASGGSDKTVRLWRVDGTLLRTLQGHTSNVQTIAFSPDGQTLASASHDNTIKLWRVNSPLIKLLNGHQEMVWRVAFSPDGQRLASVAGKEVKLWRRDGSLAKTIFEDDSRMLSLDFSPDGRTLAIVGSGGVVRLWQLDRNQRTILKDPGIGLLGVSYSPDGNRLVTVGFDYKLRLWQRDNGKFQLHQIIQAHTGRIWDIVYSRDGQFLASASADGTIKLWTSENSERLLEKPERILQGHKSEVFGVAISPNSQFIASTGGDGRLWLWKRDGTLVRIFDGKSIGLTRVAFSPDGQMLAAAGFDNTIKVWKTDGTLLVTLNGHTSNVSSIAFSPDGKTLASGGDDQLVIMWDLEQILHLNLLKYGCNWVRDYLKTNMIVENSDRSLCNL
ncbi:MULTISPECIES: AAA-like domain-containing protein [unclassified Nostoc]|uniref:WD40 domain-containing protein n=1 Tax=unclassified Nostoc TaxID=2593658 RepID=UPI002AD2E76C|nr:AAA-like domain-containing protein [Nostoc sp. DedQUE03]MDZ7977444.1 AAA-like domain-containing protein [Nostoc sp. DedQUE03]MDZ8048250.1 AAA-like domain-containing protein [Nostoc sp. DedQUE02]